MIVEDEEKDNTHGVRVNHRIKCRDKLRAPQTREKKQLLLEAMEKKERPAFVGAAICLVLCYPRPSGSHDDTQVIFSWETLSRDLGLEDGRAWVGGFLEIVPRYQGPWFSLRVDRPRAPWTFLGPAPIKP